MDRSRARSKTAARRCARYGFERQAAPGDRQGRVASGRALSSGWLIVTNLSRLAERVVAFYNKRGTCEQWIKEGKGAIKWTRLSCRTFANAVRLQLHALAYNLGNFLRTLATPERSRVWLSGAFMSTRGSDFTSNVRKTICG
jgi:hypothetical protein